MNQSPAERNARRKLYKSSRWRSIRARQLKREPWCRLCSLRGVMTRAEHVDHIEPVPEPVMKYLRKFWNGKRQSLCVGCHSRKTINERRGLPHIKGVDEDGNPVDPTHHCYGATKASSAVGRQQ